MKKFVFSPKFHIASLVVYVILLALFLTSCGKETVVIREVPRDTAAPVITQAPVNSFSKEDLYITTLEDSYPQLMTQYGRTWLIEFGNTLCDAIDGGLTLSKLAEMSYDYDVDATQLGFITGAAITAFCPYNSGFFSN